jgi:hypothetical protein
MFEIISNFRPHFIPQTKLAMIRGRNTPFTYSPYYVLSVISRVFISHNSSEF